LQIYRDKKISVCGKTEFLFYFFHNDKPPKSVFLREGGRGVRYFEKTENRGLKKTN